MKNWIKDRLAWIDNNVNLIKGYNNIPSTITDRKGNFIIYPNPFSENLNVVYKVEFGENFTFTMFNIFGQKVYGSQIIRAAEDLYNYTFDKNILSNLAPGIYLLTISENGTITYHQKLIKN